MISEVSCSITNPYTQASFTVHDNWPQKNVPNNLWKKEMRVVIGFLNSQDITYCMRVSKEFRFVVTFWGLKQQWWKQVIDGVYHELGPMVFDQGLHKCHVEPGYYKSMQVGCSYAAEHFFKSELSIPFHKRVNQEACRHFAGSRTQTEMSARDAGKFRYRDSQCGVNIWHQLSKEAIEYNRIFRFFEFCGAPDFVEKQKLFDSAKQKDDVVSRMWIGIRKKKFLECFGVESFQEQLYVQKLKEFSPKKEAAYAFRETWPKMWGEKLAKTKKYIQDVSQSLGLVEPLVQLRYEDDSISMTYPKCPYQGVSGEVTVGELADRITKQFNQEIAQADSLDKRIRCIAKVFQLREWLHAFTDGNTRTNLIELGALLTKYGAHPAILEQPFAASLLCLDDWVEYLKEGMRKWRQERAAL